jgi:hypothetical protein
MNKTYLIYFKIDNLFKSSPYTKTFKVNDSCFLSWNIEEYNRWSPSLVFILHCCLFYFIVTFYPVIFTYFPWAWGFIYVLLIYMFRYGELTLQKLYCCCKLNSVGMGTSDLIPPVKLESRHDFHSVDFAQNKVEIKWCPIFCIRTLSQLLVW